MPTSSATSPSLAPSSATPSSATPSSATPIDVLRGLFLIETYGITLKHILEREAGLSPARVAILAMVRHANARGEDLTAEMIREQWSGFRTANTHRMVPRLVAERMLRRRPSTSDHRARLLRITPEGEAALADALDTLTALSLPPAIQDAIESVGRHAASERAAGF